MQIKNQVPTEGSILNPKGEKPVIIYFTNIGNMTDVSRIKKNSSKGKVEYQETHNMKPSFEVTEKKNYTAYASGRVFIPLFDCLFAIL